MQDHRYWIATASAEHVRRGRSEGFMQVCHGTGAPLRRTAPGDGIVYYSPTVTFRGSDKLQAFTAVGRVAEATVATFYMGNGFLPHRRKVIWWPAAEAPIRPLLDRLDLTRGRANWGMVFRYGLIRITPEDFTRIAGAMGVGLAWAA
jgi:EVE domain